MLKNYHLLNSLTTFLTLEIDVNYLTLENFYPSYHDPMHAF